MESDLIEESDLEEFLGNLGNEENKDGNPTLFIVGPVGNDKKRILYTLYCKGKMLLKRADLEMVFACEGPFEFRRVESRINFPSDNNG